MQHFAIKLQEIKKDMDYYTNYDLTKFSLKSLDSKIEEISDIWLVFQKYNMAIERYFTKIKKWGVDDSNFIKNKFKKVLYLYVLCNIMQNLLLEMTELT